MLSAVFATVDPRWNEELRARTATLHKAAGASRTETASASLELSRLLEQAGSRFARQPLSAEQKRAVLRALVEGARRGDYPDYVAADQAAMAAVLLLAEAGRDRSLKPEIDALFEALAQDDRYDAARFEKLMERVKE